RLAAGDHRYMIGVAADRECESIVRRGIAGMEGGYDMEALGNLAAHLGERRLDEMHAFESEPLRPVARPCAEVGSRFDRVEHFAGARLAQEQLVEDETEVRISRAGVEQGRLGMALASVEDGRCDELDEMVHLLELAQRIGMQVPVAADEVQFAQELDGLPGEQLANHRLASRFPRRHRARKYHGSRALPHEKCTAFSSSARPGSSRSFRGRWPSCRPPAASRREAIQAGLPDSTSL